MEPDEPPIQNIVVDVLDKGALAANGEKRLDYRYGWRIVGLYAWMARLTGCEFIFDKRGGESCINDY